MVKTYLLNVINYKDIILNKVPCIVRNDLTIAPDVIIYDHVNINNINILQNKLGVTLAYTYMGDYEDVDSALDSYRLESQDYIIAYDKLKTIKKVDYDFNWNMLIIVDQETVELEITYSYIKLKDINLLNKETYLFFDACMIYESLKIVKEYTESFGNKSKLTKRETRILGYYLEIATSISKPELYLINANEIKIMKNFYEIWSIQQISESLIVSINATIDVFSFIFQHEASKKDKLSSFMFSFLTIVLGFTSLYDFFGENKVIKIWLMILFGIWGVALTTLGLYRLINFIKEEIINKYK